MARFGNNEPRYRSFLFAELAYTEKIPLKDFRFFLLTEVLASSKARLCNTLLYMVDLTSPSSKEEGGAGEGSGFSILPTIRILHDKERYPCSMLSSTTTT